MTAAKFYKVITISVSVALVCASGCEESNSSNDAPETEADEDPMDSFCSPITYANGTVSTNCEYSLEVNGVDYGQTQAEYSITSARGAGSGIRASTTFAGATHRPDGGAIKISLTDDGYELDAGQDGRVHVGLSEIDPEDPSASIDKIVVTTASGTGLVKQHTVTCPGLFAFATELEEQDEDPVPPAEGCGSVSEPDPETGCFPCNALEDLLVGHPLLIDPDVRVRTKIASDHVLTLVRHTGGVERRKVVGAWATAVANAYTAIAINTIQCAKDKGLGGYACIRLW